MTLAALILYQILFPLIGIPLLVRFVAQGRWKSLLENADQIRQRLGRLKPEELARLNGRVIWMHAASVGEVNAAATLVPHLKDLSGFKILLTASTAAGLERAQRIDGIDAALLAPLDWYPAVSRFLESTRPLALILVETELWPLTLRLALYRGVRLLLVNGRITARSYSRYRLIRGFLAPLLAGIERAAVQTDGDAERFKRLGVPEAALKVLGNLKMDAGVATEAERRKAVEIFAKLGWTGEPIWIAGSTRPGEEEIVLAAFSALKNRPLRLILAPRHMERVEEAERILQRHGIVYQLLSRADSMKHAPCPVSECLLLDRMGWLSGFYAAGIIGAFVGGTLVDVGGHNLLEPALAGVPVLFGPHTESVSEAAAALESSGGGIRTKDETALGRELERLLDDAALQKEKGRLALMTAEGLTGAARRTAEFIQKALEISRNSSHS